jgi:predicted O-methyltransferase YrrM
MAGPIPFDLTEAVSYISKMLPSELLDEDLHAVRPPDISLRPSVGPLTAGLLSILVCTRRPAHILELGTSIGYSAIAVGRAAATYGGRVTSVELDQRIARLAEENIRAASLSGTVQVVRADAGDFIASAGGPFGLILQDSDKDVYQAMLPRLVELLESGGLLVSDDVLFPIVDLPEGVRRWQRVMDDYNKALRDHPGLRTTWLPIGCGVAVSVKIA